MKRAYRVLLLATMLIALGFWIAQLGENAMAYFHGDRTAGVIAAIMLGLTGLAVSVGIVSYRRARAEWKRRVDARSQPLGNHLPH